LFRDWLAQLALGLVHCGELESLRYTQQMADEPECGNFLESHHHFFGKVQTHVMLCFSIMSQPIVGWEDPWACRSQEDFPIGYLWDGMR